MASNHLGQFGSYGLPFSTKSRYTVKFRSDLLSLLPPRNYKSILEFGCADGSNLVYFAEALKIESVEIFGVDVCKSTAPENLNFNFYHQSLESFVDRTSRTFDLILLSDVLEHIYNPWQALDRIKDALPRGGTLLISVPNLENLNYLNSIASGEFFYTPTGLMDETHIRFFSQKTLTHYLQERGYRILSTGFRPDLALADIKERVANQLSTLQMVKLQLGDVTIDITKENLERKFGQQFLVCAENV